jgi:3-dehydroquinate dehydratase-1
MICVSLGNIQFDRAIEICRHEKLVEIRADLMNLSENQLNQLINAGPEIVFTFRKSAFPDSIRSRYYRMAIEHGAKYVDIDYFQDQRIILELSSAIKTSSSRLILSLHDYEKTPDRNELKKALKLFYDEGADLAKIACMVNTDEDIVNLLSLYKRPGNKLVLGMGKKGLITRVAAIYMGAEFTFAFPTGEEQTAPGQLTRNDLEEIFRIIGKSR